MTGENGFDDHEGDESDGNIVSFPSKRERKKQQKIKDAKDPVAPSEPMFNLPPVTQSLIGVLTIWYLLLEVIGYFDPSLRYDIYTYLGFTPGAFTGVTPFQFYHLFGFVFYIFLHGSWMHFLMNTVMLAAFGTGLERFIGGRRMLEVFFISSLAGIVTHFVFYSGSLDPVIGASGGLSGIFGAAIVMLHRNGMMGRGRYGVWPFIGLWVGMSVLFGLFGSSFTGGAQIAWLAHLGGFFAGLIMIRRIK